MKINQLKAGAALSYISMGLGYIVSIIYTPIMLRLLGQSEFGLYNLVASVVAYLGVLNFGFGSAYMRYYSRYKVYEDKDNIAKLNGMFLVIFSVIGIVAVLAGMILVMYSGSVFGSKLTALELSKAKILMAILVVNLAISFPGIVFNSHITANERFVFHKLVQMIRTVVNPFAVLPVLLLGYGSVGLVVTTTVLNLTVEIANALYCVRKLKMQFSFKSFDFELMREMTVFSSFVFINLIVDQINWNVDKYILGRFYGTIAVAVYGIAAQIFMYYISFSTVISNLFVPRVHTLVALGNNYDLTILFTKVGRIQFIILAMISSGLIIFGNQFLRLWAGNSYSDSYPILLLLMLPSTIPLFQNLGIEIQRAKNIHQFRSWLYLGIALLNVVISIPLAKAYGGVGAALGTAIGQLIGNTLIMNVYYHYIVKLNMLFFWTDILKLIPGLILPIIIGIGMYITLDFSNMSVFIFSCVIYVIIYSSSMWFWGMNNFERKLFAKPINKLFH